MAITVNEYKRNFLASEAAMLVRAELNRMVADPQFTTKSLYSPGQNANTSFVDKHLRYLSEHPKLKTHEYLANLRLMTKNR